MQSRRSPIGGQRRGGQERALLPLLAAAGGVLLVVASSLALVQGPAPRAAAVASPPARSTTGVAGTAAVGGLHASGKARRPAATRAPARNRAPAPVSLRVADIDLDTGLLRVGLNADRSLEVPDSFTLAGWYERGTAPGAVGPAVIVGHYDSVDGPGVFYRLDELVAGQRIHVRRADGSRASFAVDRVEQVGKDEFPTSEVYGPVDRPELRLITCGGDFDRGTRHYRDNTIVFAHAV